jgi:hypothetical protein
MIKLKVKKKGNQLEKLVKNFHDLNGENVQVGHFASQGKHYSGYTYPELMALHHNPRTNGFDFPPRPVLDILFAKNLNLNSQGIKRILSQYRKMELNQNANKFLLDAIGKYLRNQEKRIFGSSDLAPNAESTAERKGKNSPLIDTGDLRRKVAYRTSKNKEIKES